MPSPVPINRDRAADAASLANGLAGWFNDRNAAWLVAFVRARVGAAPLPGFRWRFPFTTTGPGLRRAAAARPGDTGAGLAFKGAAAIGSTPMIPLDMNKPIGNSSGDGRLQRTGYPGSSSDGRVTNPPTPSTANMVAFSGHRHRAGNEADNRYPAVRRGSEALSSTMGGWPR